ncbi:MAG: hypothetical protein KGZ60_03275 [Truepera sp.]|nr:hypothetical protein [Truepera sp.]
MKVWLFLLTLAFSAVALASPLTAVPLRVGAAQGEISPLAITGVNYGIMMRVVGFEEYFGALNLRAIRFPPGNQADEMLLTPAVLDALKMQWELLGRPQLLLVANLFEATPEDAVAAARYLQQIGIPISAWAIGNEPDLFATNRGDPSWTPEKYCERFRAYREALMAINPDWPITGPAVSGARPGGEVFLREVLYRCGDVIDILTWHVYPTDGTWSDEAALATSSLVGQEINRFRSWLTDPVMNPLGYRRDIRLAITEFGLSWRTISFRHLEDMTAALWLADTLGQIATLGVDESYYFALQGLGGHGLIDTAGWVRPTYYVFAMLADFTGTALQVELDAPLLTAYAASNERGLQLLLVNRSTEDKAVVVEPRLEGSIEVKTLNDELFDELLAYRVTEQAAAEAVMVPARSVILVRGTP